MTRGAVLMSLVALAASAAAAATERATASSCIACHADAGRAFDERVRASAAMFLDRDAHGDAGVSCHDCHGGDPAAGTSGITLDAMHPALPDRPFVGRPGPEAIPALCGSCHSNGEYMTKHRPGSRIDQEALYRASRHGQALGRGDSMTATCVDCHGAHGILPASDPKSSVHPTRLAATCAVCHSDQARMAGLRLADGRPMPADQHERWRASVHAAGLLDRGDHASPTCNDCHGDHADLPAGVVSISEVCGSCHLREAELVADSPLGEGFEKHRAFMEEAGEEGCLDCHEASEPAAKLSAHALSNPCLACHGSHSVLVPTVAMLAPQPEMACTACHERSATRGSGEGLATDEPPTQVERLGRELAAEGQARGLAGNDLYDWLLDRAGALPEHEARAENAALPDFSTLLVRLRIGKAHRVFGNGSAEVREAIQQCTTCHATDLGPENAAGAYATALVMRNQLERLTSRAGDAASLLLAARRDGVEAPAAACELEEALRARTELGMLLHTFRVGDGSPFSESHAAGIVQADAAWGAGHAAIAEARGRKRWLAISLALIGAAVLVVTLKMRELGRRHRRGLDEEHG